MTNGTNSIKIIAQNFFVHLDATHKTVFCLETIYASTFRLAFKTPYFQPSTGVPRGS